MSQTVFLFGTEPDNLAVIHRIRMYGFEPVNSVLAEKANLIISFRLKCLAHEAIDAQNSQSIAERVICNPVVKIIS